MYVCSVVSVETRGFLQESYWHLQACRLLFSSDIPEEHEEPEQQTET